MAGVGKYNAQEVENHWYDYWMNHGYFHSEIDQRTPYTIVIPPPNVTGVLHMGHMLNNTLQDVLIRRARLKGFNACWVPGTDHASIATEAKVVAKLKSEGIEKSDLTREEFLEHAWAWTHKHGGIILEQLKKLGASCDWQRTKFTMDPDLSESVIQVFIDLYRKGLIYRGYRMVNWDPEAKTTLSDEEVIHQERQGHLYYINYAVADSDEKVLIATTRPETLLGDTAVCIHPEDPRYTHLKGKEVIVPICGRKIPIIEDTYVAMDFGTGCLKVTPAHDENDKLLGEKHQLEVIDIFNDDATLNAHGLHYKGQDRFAVRKAIVEELKTMGFLEKVEAHTHKVGTSERTGAVIEPKLSDQWFLKMKDLAQPALDAVMNNEVQLVPEKFVNTYRHWMEGVRDWNISRQLWWGHQIPAYYYGPGREDFVVAASLEEAVELAVERSGNADLSQEDLTQDADVLDTWFSSWLWPISVFDGIRNPENPEINYYYPTNDLVTAPEILFFWVARMIIAGYEYRGVRPFKNVYLTGIVRDKQRRKMSKSLGNSPDPLDLMDKYGADGVRVGMLLSSPAGNDLMFDEDLCQQGSGFVNKIWNAYRLVSGWTISEEIAQSDSDRKAIEWYAQKFQAALSEIEDHYGKYRISDALMTTYKLVWDDFCSWFLEWIKPEYGKAICADSYAQVVQLFEDNLKILHPFVPFVSEEIWQKLALRTKDQALIIAKWPEIKSPDFDLIQAFEHTKEVVSGIRTLRKEKNISFKEAIDLTVNDVAGIGDYYQSAVVKFCNVAAVQYADTAPEGALSFRVKSNEYYVPVSGHVDVQQERHKLLEELSYTEGFLKSVRGKLSNARFVDNAPEAVVAAERQKEADALAKISTINAALQALG